MHGLLCHDHHSWEWHPRALWRVGWRHKLRGHHVGTGPGIGIGIGIGTCIIPPPVACGTMVGTMGPCA